ncbi:MAG: 5-(carboxyamino)imidazole ribonucleotide mutase [Pseudomonadota bacterium]|nr:5-(carboxyamino)imidazole ribonucleotide mutase [Pseudomonadota bacterium]MEC8287295.1 5-(carboxyamino)imidazole ribonucleotide mutase [Pseudomonadota bacterium]MEC8316061.1 5-(carboxyamino)imidazole ribonucleotide mutase [Pseudomonadota bacterium]|tara:strand:+ start:5815 stop:6288 length:474 start_codon:yes stop_codon:yes gene_type:complete
MKKIAIIMGSQSDWETMKFAANILDEFEQNYDTLIISAHRTPERLYSFAKDAEKNYSIIIAGAGGSAHLPGMVASITTLPVLGVPIESNLLNGVDSLLSIVQMPKGIPVGTLAIGTSGSTNAALLAISILSINDEKLALMLKSYRNKQTESIDKIPK